MGLLLNAFALATGIFTAGFSLLALACTIRVFRRRPHSSTPPAETITPPAVTILKPLKGIDRDLYVNLESFCLQDYPAPVQMLLCLSDSSDPALDVAQKLIQNHPDKDIALVVSGRVNGSNPKISNLANAYHKVKHDILVISDSDIRVTSDFLTRAVLPFGQSEVGLVSCFYRAVAAKGLGGVLETLSINTHFLPQAATAAAFGMRFAMGAAILVRRSVFEDIGGFARLSDHIADDFILGRLVQESGSRVEHAAATVDSITGFWTLISHARHQIREYRTVRHCAPAGYLGTLMLQGFPAITLKTALLGPDVFTLALAGIILASKFGLLILLRRPLFYGILLPLCEWLSLSYWVSGFMGSQVLWRGELYCIEPGGRLTPIPQVSSPLV